MAIRCIRLLSVVALVALVTLVTLVPAGRHPAAADETVGPKHYYLVLGDSLAYGLQPNGDFTHGYADDFYAYLAALRAPRPTELVNMGCPGETTAAFISMPGCAPINSGKLTPKPGVTYTEPQLTAALTFIRQHPGKVSPVTIDVGGDDFFSLASAVSPSDCLSGQLSQSSLTAFQDALAAFDVNYSYILSQLRSALHHSGDLITMTYYDPVQNLCPAVLPLVELLNAHIQTIAEQHDVLVAPVFDAFVPNICTFTWRCISPDIHPTTLGYAVIAATLEQTADYPAAGED